MQSLMPVFPSVSEPAGHFSQLEDLKSAVAVLAGQSLQIEVLPTPAYCPGEQFLHLDAPFLPAVSEPIGQASQELAEKAAREVPSRQRVQVEDPAAVYVPPGQLVHRFEPEEEKNK